jgi:2-succinyl-5-enolpyruvyl-6-hydroxy-3-cyclohexene-1-carboxylate synthase
MIDRANINTIWATILIEELVRHGIRHACISPGSRSTPLTWAAARNDRLTTTVHFDERGAAFHALGFARASGKPVILICTSGTAVANYFPAVVEAAMDRLPLILLTADRPPELQNVGANQTIYQDGIYSHYPRFTASLPCPSPDQDISRLFEIAEQAYAHSMRRPQGPAHINCPFREPLAPVDDANDYSKHLEPLGTWEASDTPAILCNIEQPHSGEEKIDEALEYLKKRATGLVIAGRLDSPDDREAVLAASDALGWPVIPDIRSGLRLGSRHSHLAAYYDQILLSDDFIEEYAPDACLHIGGSVTSKRLLQALERWRPSAYVHVDNQPMLFDPAHVVTHHIVTDIEMLCGRSGEARYSDLDAAYGETWIEFSQRIDEYLRDTISGESDLTEPAAARLLSRCIDGEHTLFLSSSLPIRLFDMYGDPAGSPCKVVSNRGASGIDGTIAAAVGYAEASRRPLTLVIGDLAFLHDLNSLSLLRQSGAQVTIVIFNNDGGGIFSLLPIAKHEDVFEHYFSTPHGLSFGFAAEQFGIPYTRVNALTELGDEYSRQQATNRSAIIEIDLDRRATADHMREIAQQIRGLIS